MSGSSKRRFRPGRWATVTLALGLPLLVGLGVWQMQRLEWKSELIARIEERMARPPSELRFSIHVPDAYDYVRTRVEGRYRRDRQLVLTGRVEDGRAGARLIAGFVTEHGQTILVDRGWVPDMAPDPADWPPPEGRRHLAGILRLGGQAGWFTPANDGADGLWYWRDLPAMAAALDLDDPLALMLRVESDQAGGPTAAAVPVSAIPAAVGTTALPASGATTIGTLAAGDGGLPLTGETRIELPNNHFGYALTWGSLAVVLVAVYVMHGLRRRDSADDR